MTEDEKKLIQARHRLEAVQARNRALTHHRQAGGGMCALCGGERLLRK